MNFVIGTIYVVSNVREMGDISHWSSPSPAFSANRTTAPATPFISPLVGGANGVSDVTTCEWTPKEEQNQEFINNNHYHP